MTDLINSCTSAIIKGNNKTLIRLLNKTPSKQWCSKFNRFGNTLLQESILQNNKEAFNFLLLYYDLVSLELPNQSKKKTALMIALSNESRCQHSEYFATEIIKKGAFINGDCYLHESVSFSENVTKLLLEQGIDINLQDEEGNTVLHKVLAENYDFVQFLLCFGANPFIRNLEGWLPFEYSVKFNCSFETQEILFNYTFDEFTDDIHVNVEILLCLAKLKSPLFSLLINNDKIKFVVGHSGLILLVNDLLQLDVEYLTIIVNKENSFIVKIFEKNIEKIVSVSVDFFNHLRQSEFDRITINSAKNFLENLNILFESRYSILVTNFINCVDSHRLFESVIRSTNSREDICSLLTYLLSYGLSFPQSCYEMVYASYGYCDLFKLMLTVGSHYPTEFPRVYFFYMYPLCRLIYDINSSLSDIFAVRRSVGAPLELLDFFVHPNLRFYLGEIIDNNCVVRYENGKKRFGGKIDLWNEFLRKLSQQPKISSLVELSRNVVRKYLVDSFGIKNESDFYWLVKRLPICEIHKEIITFERKIY